MPGKLEVKVIGVGNVQERLRHLPAGTRPFFERAAKYGQERMKHRAKPQHSGPAKLATGVEIDIRGGAPPQNMEAHVGFYRDDYRGGLAYTVNYGRSPGKPPPVSAIRRWLVACGYQVSPWWAQRQIRERGTKGKYFLENTEEDLQKALPEIARLTERELAARWGKG